MSGKADEDILEDNYKDADETDEDADADEADEDEDTQKDKYLTFHLGSEIYGIAVYYVIEIVGLQKITETPDTPNFVKGLMNLRGQVIPVIDVRIRFGMPQREYDDHTCVIVVRLENTTVGLVVDTIDEVADIPEEKISPRSRISKGSEGRYIWAMGRTDDGVKILLDVNKLLFDTQQI